MSLQNPPALPSIELLRNEPFRVLFPLAFIIGAGGVAHWVLFTTGAMDRYLGLFHAISQMQSFMLAFACGFLMTAIPKRTRSAPASLLEIGAVTVLIPVVSLGALFEWLVVAEGAYAAALLILAQFAVRRFLSRSSGRRPPTSFAAVPVGFAAGLAGSVLIGWAALGGRTMTLGRALALEGMFECVVVGIGSFFFALALHGKAAPDAAPTRRDRLEMVAYALAGLVLIGALVAQDLGWVRAALLVRAAVILLAFGRAGAFRRPTLPGANRWLMTAAAFAIPTGLLAAAAFPEHRLAAMHLAYVGGFGLLAFAVAAHVTLGHTGFPAAQGGRPWPVVAFGVFFLVAAAMRAGAPASPDYYFRILGGAAALWLVAATVWTGYLVPKMWQDRGGEA